MHLLVIDFSTVFDDFYKLLHLSDTNHSNLLQHNNQIRLNRQDPYLAKFGSKEDLEYWNNEKFLKSISQKDKLLLKDWTAFTNIPFSTAWFFNTEAYHLLRKLCETVQPGDILFVPGAWAEQKFYAPDCGILKPDGTLLWFGYKTKIVSQLTLEQLFWSTHIAMGDVTSSHNNYSDIYKEHFDNPHIKIFAQLLVENKFSYNEETFQTDMNYWYKNDSAAIIEFNKDRQKKKNLHPLTYDISSLMPRQMPNFNLIHLVYKPHYLPKIGSLVSRETLFSLSNSNFTTAKLQSNYVRSLLTKLKR